MLGEVMSADFKACTLLLCRQKFSGHRFFFFKMSLMISFRTEILHMHIIYHRLIHNRPLSHYQILPVSRDIG